MDVGYKGNIGAGEQDPAGPLTRIGSHSGLHEERDIHGVL
jgi:hypothetical protein